MKYEDRIIAYIDILGFKEIIADSRNSKSAKVKKIYDLLMLARDTLDIDDPKYLEYINRKVTQFSDLLVISFPMQSESGIFSSIVDILHLQMRFVHSEVLCRGCIKYGKIIHNGKIIFGPGLIDAYNSESKAAFYPRVILDESIIKLAQKFRAKHHSPAMEKESIEGIVSRDTDGLYYVDYISKVVSEFDDGYCDYARYLSRLNNIINAGQKIRDPGVRVKIGWLIEKFNNVVKVMNMEESLILLSKEYEEELVDFFRSLEPIEAISL